MSNETYAGIIAFVVMLAVAILLVFKPMEFTTIFIMSIGVVLLCAVLFAVWYALTDLISTWLNGW